MKSNKMKSMKKRAIALLLCMAMVMNGSISVAASDNEGTQETSAVDVHVHNEECYKKSKVSEDPVCGKEVVEGHVHGDACYEGTDTQELTCTLAVTEGHSHGDSCFEKVLSCGIENHAHDDNCYQTEKKLSCGQEASEEHPHDEECYEEETECICKKETHSHDDGCYQQNVICGLEEIEAHNHGEGCYTTKEKTLICELAEVEAHVHSDKCFEWKEELVCEINVPEAKTVDETPTICEICQKDPCDCKNTVEEEQKVEEPKEKEPEAEESTKTEYSAEGEEGKVKVAVTLEDAADLPDDAKLVTEPETLDEEETAAIEETAKAAGLYIENMTVLDIRFDLEVAGEEGAESTIENPQPANPVNVSVILPEITAEDEVTVYHVGTETVTDENGEEKEVLKVDDMKASVNAETGAVEFKTPHFSTYVFIENTDTAVAAMMEMLVNLPSVETVAAELLAYAEAEDWDGYKEYYVEIGTAGKTAYEAYTALSEEQKANIENLEKLTALETIWSAEDLESAAEVAVVIAMIDQLPTYEEVAETLTKLEEDEDWEGYEKYIKALAKKAWPAYYAYEALSEEQKALVTNYDRLMETSCVWSIVTLEEEACPHVANHQMASSAMPEILQGNINPKPADPGLKVSKNIVATEDPNEFDLILEAYATGSKVAVPMDIVLVMDRSGSMAQSQYYLSVDELIPGYTYYTHDYDNDTYKDGTPNPDKKITFGYTGAYPSPVTWCDDCKAWIKENHNSGNNKIVGYEVVAGADGISNKYRFFETNMQATERSVREFINAIIRNGENTGALHRISMISYNGDKAYLYKKSNPSGVASGSGILTAGDYADAFITVNDKTNILKFIDGYSNISYPHKGKTPTHLGMIMAEDALSSSKKPVVEGEKIARQELVVLFADGAPGEGVNIYSDWLNKTKEKAKSLKSEGVSVFTVGFYDDASSEPSKRDGTTYYEKSNKLFYDMASEDCFFPAVGATALSEAFQKIADKFASQPLEFDDKMVMREEISKYFVLDIDTNESNIIEREIKVETADCIGKNGENFIFDTTTKSATGVTVEKVKTEKSPVTDVINVTGFNYGADENSVKSYVTPAGVTMYEGKKLILTVPIETREGFWGGNNVPTNDATTGLYHPKGTVTNYLPSESGLEKLDLVLPFPMPEANVPMTINIEAQDKTIYYAGAVNATELVKGITAGYSEDSDEWVKPTTSVTVNADGTLTPLAEWMDDYAEITWHSTSIKPATEINNKNCGAYEYEVVMTSRNNAESAKVNQSGHSGVNEAGGAIAGAAAAVNTTLSQAEAIGNVHILIPTITFKDSVVDLGFKTNADYYNATNRVKTITWNQLDTTHVEIPAVSGTEPTFAYGYTPASQEIFLDTPVDVVVSYEGRTDVTSDELMAVTTFNWETCDATVYHHETENISSHRGTETSYEFWIHTNDVYELPSTGGIGTYWYTIGGVVLMMGTSLMIYKKKREEVLRSR